MSMYCDRDEIINRIGLEVIEAIEATKPNIVEKSIRGVCSIIDASISPKYYQYMPFNTIPPVLVPISVSIAVSLITDPVDERNQALLEEAKMFLKKLNSGEAQLDIRDEQKRDNFVLGKVISKYNWNEYYHNGSRRDKCRSKAGY